ncbi:flagellar basal body rod protein FlgC [candidate division WOR-1 bacterium RIFOXYA12_FULL_52_29]|uniref:Flagellar basal-body rod protein FlgC n=1 Tax=candidate division WOR-1 bacterium RIFOXYC12_FULL_54_18 TaxID=1802584 RepID=A0A1F4T5C1_UNCSA|nr:MAG: flagellar basal body rod protein FlgC [candidate division WOR-1 bacterium RIFOXYA2_FULL_51_19]OGC17491.1 MAG: flagellar basal body rod protein FlgC [candidate division WOR-1 bacterium RIFOXYA12_FULL_52_29]OGC26349.1 MAG: flagellar basal body rod protein FlgC [candidate division WOR-1 bacterium RIFOXYB2_FULL_45_9]OGC27908.1 MAG: flagellar basal body rod protein FlgC [candidate division WOR-1 bacterium RIFOXYC12_FULL_54_18]OGC29804.1 MAG: flagellar basal body rod protein FlgC [candidate d
MGLNQAMRISVDGMDAQRITQELIASNLANASTTRTVFGEPYKRKVAVYSEKPITFAQTLSRAENRLATGGGVKVEVVDDKAPFEKVYNPGHPDADEQGYVMMPNVKMSTEMASMVEASKYYEANITAFNATKKMLQDALQIQ